MKIGDSLEHYFTNNKDLRSEIKTLNIEKNGFLFTFYSDLGVFSKNHIDYGSRILVDSILKSNEEFTSLLDVGCGYGFIGITLSKIKSCPVLLSDVNTRALHLCQKNIKKNQVDGETVLSNCYENIDGKFDLIVTNPPIRAGKEIVLNILKNAKKHLNKKGSLWFVIRKDQGAKSIMKELSLHFKCEVIEKSKGFYVIKAKTN